MARNRWGKDIRRLCGLPILTDYFRPERGFLTGEKGLCPLRPDLSGLKNSSGAAVRCQEDFNFKAVRRNEQVP